MRDDAVLGRALPLDRGLGPIITISLSSYVPPVANTYASVPVQLASMAKMDT